MNDTITQVQDLALVVFIGIMRNDQNRRAVNIVSSACAHLFVAALGSCRSTNDMPTILLRKLF